MDQEHVAFRFPVFYIVQRCWQAGPQVFAPVDYRRLFTTRRDAEEAAYHSAHAWAASKNPNESPHVRTLLLPPGRQKNITDPAPSSSYGFVAHGSMFWTRPVVVSLVEGSFAFASEQQVVAVLTNNVVGGSGKSFGRGTEVLQGRAFGGSDQARDQAVQVCAALQQTRPGLQYEVVTLPVGRPAEYATGGFLQDWPRDAGATSMPPPTSPPHTITSSGSSDGESTSWMMEQNFYPSKRALAERDSFPVSPSPTGPDFFIEVENPFLSVPDAKRQRRVAPVHFDDTNESQMELE